MSGYFRPASSRRPRIISFAPRAWSAMRVFSERMTQTCCMRCAILGISSVMCRPGTLVGMARNGPPVAVPGFGAQVSSWLAPPASQSRMTRFCCFLRSPATAGAARALRPVMSAAKAAAPAASVPRKPRRSSTWPGEPQKVPVRDMGDPRSLPSDHEPGLAALIRIGGRLSVGEFSLQFREPFVLGPDRLRDGGQADAQEDVGQSEHLRRLVHREGGDAHEYETTHDQKKKPHEQDQTAAR